MKGLLKIDLEQPGSPPGPGKVSEMFLDFAHPLTSLDPDGPPRIDDLRNVLTLAEMCWNLPVFEVTDPAAHARYERGFQDVLRATPPPIAALLRQLIVERKTRFGSVPFLVTIRVESDGTARAQVIAEARMPPSTAAANRGRA